MAAQYSYPLVFVSIAVAILASYTALELASRITASRGWSAHAWLGGGALAMGAGIWSMHFIGMLAFSSPIPLGYDLIPTFLSLLIAILASAFALYVASRPSLTWKLLAAAGVIMGVAIVSMHYVGMAAIVLLAIAGMHYTAMAAVHIAPDAVRLSGAVTDEFWLAGAIAAATLAVLLVTMALSLMDAHMTARTERITASLEHAQESIKAKDEFLAMPGHELRNPLAAVSNAVALLDKTQPHTATYQLASDIIRRQTKHLQRMVDDLLDVGRVMTGKMALHTQRLDLYACVTSAVAAMKLTGRTAQHRLECSGASVWIEGDPTRIEQVVANLLANSLAYSPAGSSVWVTVQESCGHAIVTVKDNGVGIRSEDKRRALDVGFDAHLTKPADLERLDELLASAP